MPPLSPQSVHPLLTSFGEQGVGDGDVFDRCDREMFDLLAGHPVFCECVGPFVADVANVGFNPS